MDDPLAVLLRSLDTPDPILTAGEVARWPAATLGTLEDLGLLRATANASYAACPSCECGHVEEVVACDDGGTSRFYIPCPESLRFEINPSDLRQWTFDWHALARLAARELNLRGSVEVLVPDRVWQLGRQTCGGLSRVFLLARGLLWPDGTALQSALGSSAKRVVLVASAPPPQWWSGLAPAVVRLSDVASLLAHWDLPGVSDAIRRGDRHDAAVGTLDVTAKKNKVLLRRTSRGVPDEKFDELVAQEYRRLQSYTEVWKALKAQGWATSRSAVGRAMKRMGGPTAVLRLDEVRFEKPVSSRKRDKPQKS